VNERADPEKLLVELSRNLPVEDPEDPDPSFPSPKRSASESDAEKLLEEIAAKRGGELHAEALRRTVGLMPTRTADGSFVNRTCPRCGSDEFWHEYGDEFCRCAGCRAELDVDELIV
jgi:hypothetical protein